MVELIVSRVQARFNQLDRLVRAEVFGNTFDYSPTGLSCQVIFFHILHEPRSSIMPTPDPDPAFNFKGQFLFGKGEVESKLTISQEPELRRWRQPVLKKPRHHHFKVVFHRMSLVCHLMADLAFGESVVVLVEPVNNIWNLVGVRL